jgi:L-lactate dehydrogenase complex protein LldE
LSLKREGRDDERSSRNAGTSSGGSFITCLVDLFGPSVGFSAIKLLEDAGAKVEMSESQTC